LGEVSACGGGRRSWAETVLWGPGRVAVAIAFAVRGLWFSTSCGRWAVVRWVVFSLWIGLRVHSYFGAAGIEWVGRKHVAGAPPPRVWLRTIRGAREKGNRTLLLIESGLWRGSRSPRAIINSCIAETWGRWTSIPGPTSLRLFETDSRTYFRERGLNW